MERAQPRLRSDGRGSCRAKRSDRRRQRSRGNFEPDRDGAILRGPRHHAARRPHVRRDRRPAEPRRRGHGRSAVEVPLRRRPRDRRAAAPTRRQASHGHRRRAERVSARPRLLERADRPVDAAGHGHAGDAGQLLQPPLARDRPSRPGSLVRGRRGGPEEGCRERRRRAAGHESGSRHRRRFLARRAVRSRAAVDLTAAPGRRRCRAADVLGQRGQPPARKSHRPQT